MGYKPVGSYVLRKGKMWSIKFGLPWRIDCWVVDRDIGNGNYLTVFRSTRYNEAHIKFNHYMKGKF